jgi:hypothetical protein
LPISVQKLCDSKLKSDCCCRDRSAVSVVSTSGLSVAIAGAWTGITNKPTQMKSRAGGLLIANIFDILHDPISDESIKTVINSQHLDLE